MKKITFSVLMLTAIYSCNNADNKTETGTPATTETKVETAPPAAAEASIIGKWHAVNMKMDGQDNPATDEAMKKQLAGENMFYEFSSDGKYKTGSKSVPENSGTYTKNGDALTSTDATGKAETMSIIKLTATELNLRSDKEKMIIILEKM